MVRPVPTPSRNETITGSFRCAAQQNRPPMSALPPKADIAKCADHVRFVPKADSCGAAIRRWNRKPGLGIVFKVFRGPRFARTGLVDLDSDRRDERRPFGDLGFNEAPEFFWR